MLIKNILETVKDSSLSTSDIFLSGYAESYRKLRRISFNGGDNLDLEKIEKKRFHSLLSKLRKDGLIKKTKNDKTKKTFWKITEKGIKKLNFLQRQKIFKKDVIRLPKVLPVAEEDFLKVIIFDIPELHKKKREWLRRTLVNLGFEKVQLSVWMGKSQLPEDFFYHLRQLKLLNYIHIFAIKKKGSLSSAI